MASPFLTYTLLHLTLGLLLRFQKHTLSFFFGEIKSDVFEHCLSNFHLIFLTNQHTNGRKCKCKGATNWIQLLYRSHHST